MLKACLPYMQGTCDHLIEDLHCSYFALSFLPACVQAFHLLVLGCQGTNLYVAVSFLCSSAASRTICMCDSTLLQAVAILACDHPFTDGSSHSSQFSLSWPQTQLVVKLCFGTSYGG